jgi:hypothetical protein
MADPSSPGARPGARPITAGQRPTGPGSPAAAGGGAPPLLPDLPEVPGAPEAPGAPAPPAPRSSGSRSGPVQSAARTSGSKGAPLDATPPASSGSHMAAMSPEIQARTSGLKIKPEAGDVKQRLREGALDTVLNAASILADTWEDFRRQDRFFKYKAAIIAAWVFLSVTSFFVAFPGSMFDAKNRLGARLVDTTVNDLPVYMIVNDSGDAWREVTVVVNGRYRTAVGTVEPNGGTLTFNIKQLKGDNDQAAPLDLVITDLQLRTDDGNAWLKKDGELR